MNKHNDELIKLLKEALKALENDEKEVGVMLVYNNKREVGSCVSLNGSHLMPIVYGALKQLKKDISADDTVLGLSITASLDSALYVLEHISSIIDSKDTLEA